MKILFADIVPGSIVSSLHASFNYPEVNIQSQFLYKRYQSSINYDLITFDFLAEYPYISSFWYGHTNATRLILRLYDGSGLLLHTVDVIDVNPVIDAYHFATVQADYATLEVFGAVGVYLGGVGLGVPYDMPNPFGSWTEVDTDNSFFTTSRAGQTLQNYIEPLRGYRFQWSDIERSVMQDIQYLVRLSGIGLPLWIDFFNTDHNFLDPLYGIISQPFNATKNGRRYNFAMQFEEAR